MQNAISQLIKRIIIQLPLADNVSSLTEKNLKQVALAYMQLISKIYNKLVDLAYAITLLYLIHHLEHYIQTSTDANKAKSVEGQSHIAPGQEKPDSCNGYFSAVTWGHCATLQSFLKELNTDFVSEVNAFYFNLFSVVCSHDTLKWKIKKSKKFDK